MPIITMICCWASRPRPRFCKKYMSTLTVFWPRHIRPRAQRLSFDSAWFGSVFINSEEMKCRSLIHVAVNYLCKFKGRVKYVLILWLVYEFPPFSDSGLRHNTIEIAHLQDIVYSRWCFRMFIFLKRGNTREIYIKSHKTQAPGIWQSDCLFIKGILRFSEE